MGCGAICGNTSTVAETTLKQTQLLRLLIPKIHPNGILLKNTSLERFLKELELNPHRYVLKSKSSIDKNQSVPSDIMEKWKIILFGLDTELQIYVNCLGYSKKSDNRTKIIKQQSNISQQNQQKPLNLQSALDPSEQLPHPCFQQIEKDLDRTFQLPQLQKQSFNAVLRRIANYFPKMGYTQGINFIVGYFLIIGFSEQESFWLFVHIALNRRYMLLGLFQDGFPLSTVYITLFKNILKRKLPTLSQHFNENMLLNDSLWVFKWFITYYLYSFPLEMCKYVWDLVIGQGGIGLVNFAIGITSHLEPYLLELSDQCEVSEFFCELKELEIFNKYVKIDEVLKIAYAVKIEERDLEGVDCEKGGIYAKYFVSYWKKQIRQGVMENCDIIGVSMVDLKRLESQDDSNQRENGLNNKKVVNLANTGSTADASGPISNVIILTAQAQKEKGKRRLSIDENDDCIPMLAEWYQTLAREREQFVKMKGLNNFRSNRINIADRKSQNSNGNNESSALRISGIKCDKISSGKDESSDRDKGNNFEEPISPQRKTSPGKDLKHKFSFEERSRLNLQDGDQMLHTENDKANITHRSSYRNIHKRHHVSTKINEIWDEEEDIINESRDKITDMEIIRSIPGIPKVKIQIDSEFGDLCYENESENYNYDGNGRDQFSEDGIRKRSGSKISQNDIYQYVQVSNSNQFASKSNVRTTKNSKNDHNSSRNKVKTQQEIIPISNQMRKQQKKKGINIYECIDSTSVHYKPTSAASGKAIPMMYPNTNHQLQPKNFSSKIHDNPSSHQSKNNPGKYPQATKNQNSIPEQQSQNRFVMAGKNVMSSMSISNASASNKSSTSSHQNGRNNRNLNNGIRKAKENGVNINLQFQSITGLVGGTRNCTCAKGCRPENQNCNKKATGFNYNQHHPSRKEDQDCQNMEEYDVCSRIESSISNEKSETDFDRDLDRKYEYQRKMNELSYTNDKSLQKELITNGRSQRDRKRYEWGINSNSQGPDPTIMVNSTSKYSAGSDVEIYDGGQLFKKKNRISNRIGGGIGIIPQSTHFHGNGSSQRIEEEKCKEKEINFEDSNTSNMMNTNKLDHYESCESILLPGNSEGQSSRFSGGKSRNTGNNGNYGNGNDKNLEFQIQSVKD